MIARIDQFTAAHRLASAAPGCPWHIPWMAKGIGGANLVYRAKRPLIEQLFGVPHCRKVELVVGAHQRDTIRRNRGANSIRFVERQTEWLLTEDMLSSRRCREERFLVQVMRQTDIDV